MSDDNNDLDVVGADDWYDLHIGDKAIMKGKIMAARPGSDTILLADHAWTDTAISIKDEGGFNAVPFQLGAKVKVIVERTEDGLATTSDDISTLL